LRLNDRVEHLDPGLEIHVALEAQNRQLGGKATPKVQNRIRMQIAACAMGEDQGWVSSFGLGAFFLVVAVIMHAIQGSQGTSYRLWRESNVKGRSRGRWLIHGCTC
jgi:hypothetical protein